MTRYWDDGEQLLEGKLQTGAELPASLGGSPFIRLTQTAYDYIVPGYEVVIDSEDLDASSLRVRFRASASAVDAVVRLYNVTDSEAVGAEVDIDATAVAYYELAGITAVSGRKTYALQAHSAGSGEWIAVHESWILPDYR